ncbi:endo-1,4-beta-xylanase [Mucilaginibacter daejeonensis]|uniref:endo-1,4-beta-xylanase n=1 Tax=Mucilaginibacter daejeonensis TaxID=398049 RepID=UPI001D171D4E|nr:endo-1,4-beta-xylanase [Mucilaginibacter daejeonensis]UEG54814.1 endo-1,4-beta-xylanase [Mucilaginibacter daejeonensis]
MRNVSLTLVAVCMAVGACKTDKLDQPVPGNAADTKTALADTMKILKTANANIPIGAAVSSSLLSSVGSAYRETVKRHYNAITAENDMKMNALNTSKYVWNFAAKSTIPQFAKDFAFDRIHGHVLVWHRALPSHVTAIWTASASATQKRDTLDNMMRRHITNTVAYYSNNFLDASGKPLVRSWDVVNEAYDDSGVLRTGNAAEGSIWMNYMGEDYIEKAFRYARQAANANGNTDLKLFYNDYGHDYSSSKRNAIYNKVNALKLLTEGGKPIIDGVAMQMHIRYNTPKANVEDAILKMKQTGLKVFISELDINLRTASDQSAGTVLSASDIATRELLQKQLYKDVVEIYTRIVPVNQRWGITLWNVGDGDSAWGDDAKACLYDLNYTRKTNFYYFYDGLQIRP